MTLRRLTLAVATMATLLASAALVPAAHADNTWAIHQRTENKSDYTLRTMTSRTTLIDNTSSWVTRPAPSIAATTGANTIYFTNRWTTQRSRVIEATVRYEVFRGTTKLGEVSTKSGVACEKVTVTGHCSDYHRYESADTTGAPQVAAGWSDDGGPPENFNTTITFRNAPTTGRGSRLQIDSTRVAVNGPLARVRVHCAGGSGTRCVGRLSLAAAGAFTGAAGIARTAWLGWQGYSLRANRSGVVYVPISRSAATILARSGPRRALAIARSVDGRRVVRSVLLQ